MKLQSVLFCLLFLNTALAQSPIDDDIADRGLLNNKRKLVAAPVYSGRIIAGNEKTVTVNIIIDEKGNVVSAEADNDVTIKELSIAAALKTKFDPYIVNGKAVKSKGYLTYGFSRKPASDQGTPAASDKSQRSKTVVEINNTDRVNIEKIKDEIWGNAIDDGDSAILVQQIGLEKYLLINKKQRKEDLPKCIQQFLTDKTSDPFGNFTINVIAEYEHDLMIDTEWKCILEVSEKENKKVKGDCKVKKTFYIAIPRDDLKPYIHLEIDMKSSGETIII